MFSLYYYFLFVVLVSIVLDSVVLVSVVLDSVVLVSIIATSALLLTEHSGLFSSFDYNQVYNTMDMADTRINSIGNWYIAMVVSGSGPVPHRNDRISGCYYTKSH